MEKSFSLQTEILGGIINAALISYALILNPAIVSATGMPFPALMTTTILVTIIFTFLVGVYARVPFIQSVYMGENAFFAFTVVLASQIDWRIALGIVFWSGVIFAIVTFSGLRKRLAVHIPKELGLAWGSAVSFFLLYLALANAGVFTKNPLPGLPTIPGKYYEPQILSFFLLTALIIILYKLLPFQIRGIGMLISIIVALLIGPLVYKINGEYITYPSFAIGFSDPSPIIAQVDLIKAWNYAYFIIIFFLIAFVDVTGTLKALVTPLKFKNEEEIIEKVMRVEGFSIMGGAYVGQPTVGTYIESGGAVAAGARTGIASIVTALVLIPTLFITPFFSNLPPSFLLWATAPALAAVSGFILMKVFEEIDFRNNPQATILILMTLPGVISGNLLLAFTLPMASIAGYEYLTKKKASIAPIIISLIGFIILGLYHY
jgi:Permeases